MPYGYYEVNKELSRKGDMQFRSSVYMSTRVAEKFGYVLRRR